MSNCTLIRQLLIQWLIRMYVKMALVEEWLKTLGVYFILLMY